jgi:hypothetical protein
MQGICKGCIIQIDIKRMLPMGFFFLQFYDVATLPKFGYMLEKKVEKFINLAIFR